MDDLRDIRSLIVPLFFVPMGRLKDEKWFKETRLTGLHKELLIKCMEHDFYWVEKLIDLSFSGKWYAQILQPFYRFFVRIARYKVKKAGLTIKSYE
jgi:hypothetical protein